MENTKSHSQKSVYQIDYETVKQNKLDVKALVKKTGLKSASLVYIEPYILRRSQTPVDF